MDNPETLVTPEKNVRAAIKNGQSRDTDSTG